jgi:curved DNA-binding protein CbpA
MAVADYYSILMVDEDATQDEVKKAYRRCVRLYHPDVGGREAAGKFKEVVRAYKILSDPAERCCYDRARKMGLGSVSPMIADRNANDKICGETPSVNGSSHRSLETLAWGRLSNRQSVRGGPAKTDPRLTAMSAGELLDRAVNSTNRYVRRKAIELLQKKGAAEAVSYLMESLNDPATEVRMAALRALGELRSRRAAGAVALALDSPCWQIRYQALMALGKIGSRQVAGQVLKLLEDPYALVREEAERTLSIIGDRRVLRIVRGKVKGRSRVASGIHAAMNTLKAWWKS